MMASCDRRRRAAATSLSARVIFCVFLTDVIRLRIALRLGMLGGRLARLGVELLGEVGEGALDRRAHRRVDLLAGLLALGVLLVGLEVPAFANLLQDVAAVGIEERVELGLVAAQRLDRI